MTSLTPKRTPKSVIFPFTNSSHPQFGKGVVFQHHGPPPPVSRESTSYCGGIFMHIATTGLLAGTGLRQVAERSVGMTAGLRRAPQ